MLFYAEQPEISLRCAQDTICDAMRTIDLPRKHHFNPRFYLDRWTGRDKQLCEMRLINGKIVPKRPDGVATAGHALFYEERGWSGRRESNPHMQLGKLLYYHYTTPAT